MSAPTLTQRDRIIDLVKKSGPMRSVQIASKLKLEPDNVSAQVSQLITNGTFVGCKVTGERGQQVWEVRIAAGAGMAVPPFEPRKREALPPMRELSTTPAPAAQPVSATPLSAPEREIAREIATEGIDDDSITALIEAVPEAGELLAAGDTKFRCGVLSDGSLVLRDDTGHEFEYSRAQAAVIAIHLMRAGYTRLAPRPCA